MFAKIVFLMLFAFAPLSLQATVILITDFDGTLILDQKSPFRTYYYLTKVEHLHSIIQYKPAYDTLMPVFPVSVDEYEDIELLLAKGDGKIKSLKPFSLKKDPLSLMNSKNSLEISSSDIFDRPSSILPGFYYLNSEIAFKRYRHNPQINYLLEDFKLAKKRQELSKINKSFKGLTFDTFSWIMNNPKEGEISINTARSQTHNDFLQAFQFLVKTKDLNSLNQTTFRIHQGNGFASREHGKSLIEKKVEGLRLEAGGIAMKRLNSQDTAVLHIDQDKAIKGVTEVRHTVIVAENDAYLSTLFLQEIEHLSKMKDYRKKLKFIFIFAGDKEYLEESRHLRGYRAVVFDQKGFTRPITDKELFKELHISRETARKFGIKFIKYQVNRINPPIKKNKKSKVKSCKKTFTQGKG